MKHTDLPSPGLINKAGELRLCMAQAISYVQTMAKYQANGKSKHAKTLATFLTAAQTEVANWNDTVVPLHTSATINGDVLTITYPEPLAPTLTPPSAFSYIVAGVTKTVLSVVVSGTTVVLKGAAAATAGQVVTWSYTQPSIVIERIQDPSGNQAANRFVQSCTNITP